jgi:PAS domain S-box-containing protein
MEKEVYQAKEYQEKLLNSLNDSVIAVNMDRVIIACNNAVEDMFGYRKEEIMGKSSLMMYPDRHAFENINRKAIRQIKADGHFEGEITVKHKNDRIFPVYASATLLLDQAGNPQGIVGVFQDLSEKKELERELEQQRLAAIRSDRLRSLGEMAAGIAHELNQPLSGVRGLAEHLLIAVDRGWSVIDRDVREKLSLIIEQADRMSHVIEHVRMFSRGSVWLERQPTDSNQVVQSCLEMVGEQIRQRGVELVLELTDGLPMIDVNPFSLEEVLINVLINARDAVEDSLEKTPDPSPRIVIRTVQETENSNHIVRIEVRDNGAGISSDILPRIFEPFFTTKAVDKGTGLGLSISKSIVEGFGGGLTIDSTPGKGTTVVILIPVKSQGIADESKKNASNTAC